jgi:hypothetical protein
VPLLLPLLLLPPPLLPLPPPELVLPPPLELPELLNPVSGVDDEQATKATTTQATLTVREGFMGALGFSGRRSRSASPERLALGGLRVIDTSPENQFVPSHGIFHPCGTSALYGCGGSSEGSGSSRSGGGAGGLRVPMTSIPSRQIATPRRSLGVGGSFSTSHSHAIPALT